MKQPVYLTMLLAGSLALAACGGGGGSTSAPPDNGNNPGDQDSGTTAARVSGPLDTVQDPLSEEVFGALADGSDGTPLSPVIECADNAVTFGALDIADSVLVSLEAGAASGDPQSALTVGADNIQAAAEQFVADLQNLFVALAEQDCRSSGSNGDAAPGFPDGNPLAGTPLAPLGEALAPVLAQFPEGGDGDAGQPSDLGALADFFTALNQAMQDGLSQVPAEALEAPVVGGVFGTLSSTLDDLEGLVAAVSIFDETGATAATQQLVEGVLVNALTQVVPVSFFEEQAGVGSELSDRIRAGAAEIAGAFGSLEAVLDPAFNDLLGDALQPLIGPLGDQVLPAVLGPLTDALAGGGLPDGGNGGNGPTGTPLDAVIGVLTQGFDGLGGLEDTPLGAVLTALQDAFGGDLEFDLVGQIEDLLAPLFGGLF